MIKNSNAQSMKRASETFMVIHPISAILDQVNIFYQMFYLTFIDILFQGTGIESCPRFSIFISDNDFSKKLELKVNL